MATRTSSNSSSSTIGSTGSTSSPSYETGVDRIIQQNEQIIQALALIASNFQYSGAKRARLQQTREEYKRRWKEEIFRHKLNDPNPNSRLRPLRSSFRFPSAQCQVNGGHVQQPRLSETEDTPEESRELEDMFSPDRPWNKWQYRLAYPVLSKFLGTADSMKREKTEIKYEDFFAEDPHNLTDEWDSTVKIVEGKEMRQNVADLAEFWKKIRTRIRDSTSSGLGRGALDRTYKIPCRIMYITDLSATVAALLLGSTPRLDLAFVAPFIERYLKFSNSATASLIISGDSGKPAREPQDPREADPSSQEVVKPVNTYLFEYHFAFYYVPTVSMDPDLVNDDFRGVRSIASFDRGSSNRHRYIYQEQLSFILLGHGGDVFTCTELAEKYYRNPALDSKNHHLFIGPRGWRPHSMFLSWIQNSLHHVSARWQTAIDAVDSQIDSPSDVIFHEDNPDLLSDDPNFSRSKTYFWAIQVYKLFDDTLTKTISTWDQFQIESLDKVNDGNVEHWDDYVLSINKAIDGLRAKLDHVRKKRDEVVHLRDGLFGASSLFDSRKSVKQSDHIRDLTYVNLLFLPLTFCTSVFGMQTIIPDPIPMKDFIISMPCIAIFTVLLIININDIERFIEYSWHSFTDSLRDFMRNHRRKNWKKTAERLEADFASSQIPVKKRSRNSTQWMYVAYLLEAALVTLPVNEVRAAFGLYGLRAKYWQKLPDTLHDVRHTDSVTLAQKVGHAKKKKKTKQRRQEQRSLLAQWILATLRNVFNLAQRSLRFILLVIWIPLLLAELVLLYAFTFLYFMYRGSAAMDSEARTPDDPLPFDWYLPLHLLGLHDVHHYPAQTPAQRARGHWRHASEYTRRQNGMAFPQSSLRNGGRGREGEAGDNDATKPQFLKRMSTLLAGPRRRTATAIWRQPKRPAVQPVLRRMPSSPAATAAPPEANLPSLNIEPDLEQGHPMVDMPNTQVDGQLHNLAVINEVPSRRGSVASEAL